MTDWKQNYGTVPLSSELVAEALEWQKVWGRLQRQMMADLQYSLEQQELDRIHGPRLGPDRHHLYEITKQKRFELRGQRALAQLNGRPGRLRRAS